MPEVILPNLQPLTKASKERLIMLADTYARTHKERILHYLETGEITIEEMPLLDNVPEIKEWLIREYNAWRYPVDPVEQGVRAGLESQLPPRPEDLASFSQDQRNALEASLRSYISKYEVLLPNGNIVSRAKLYLDEIERIREREKEKLEWESVDFLSYDALMAYFRHHPGTPFFPDLDNCLWDIVRGEPLDISRLRRFMRDMPRSSHFSEATEIDKEYSDWETIKEKRNLDDVFNYIRSHPVGFFLDEARGLLDVLKKEKLAEIKQHVGKYKKKDYDEWTKASGIFTKAEFIEAGIVTEESLKALEFDKDQVLKQKQVSDYDCPSGCTDVYFLGIPSTGKTCILMGFVNAVGHLVWDPNRFGGEYGLALQALCDQHITPGSTAGDFATLITGKVYDKKLEGVVHPINLIEMAGETFATKVATNPDGEISIADFGDGIPQMLANPNEKLFFIVIDPTSDVAMIRQEKEVGGRKEQVETPVSQRQTLYRFCQLLAAPENAEIMRKVRGLYIITTKADCLGPRECREEKAETIVNDRYGDSLFTLQELCHPDHYDLNALTDHEIRIFPFSLGNFYLGDVFDYDRTDCDRILRLISRLAAGETIGKKGWDRVREWLNKR